MNRDLKAVHDHALEARCRIISRDHAICRAVANGASLRAAAAAAGLSHGTIANIVKREGAKG